MADKAKQDMIDNFIGITGVDSDRARFYLESSGWNLEIAMGSFYEGDGDDVEEVVMPQAPPPRQEPAAPQPMSQDPPPAASGSSSSSKKKRTGATKKPGNSRFATIGSMRSDEDSDSSSADEGQTFYAGGSERSGQQIIGPKKKRGNVVEDLFKSAREHGAEEAGTDEPKPRKAGSAFGGSGYRLGETEEEPTTVTRGAPIIPDRKPVDCVLKLWKDGFSVDDGPLRDFKDAANREFLDAISKGEVPNELIRAAKGGEVNLNMEDHRTENYVKPKASLRAFAGEGHALGSPVPNVVASSSSAPSTSSAAKSPSAASAPASSVTVDDSKPSTSMQIRLADGSRLVGKFNHSHTVSDVRRHINSMRPQYEGATYILQTTFPNRELTNESETIEQAKLINAVVVQRMK